MFDFHHSERLLFGASAGAFVVLTGIIALMPAIQSQSSLEPLPADEPLTDKQKRGLKVYVDEGCAYCHTQQVRPLPMDSDLGRPSVAADFARLERLGAWRQTPAVLGSERTGPDLTNIGTRQPSANWHHMHLYQPRAVVEDSVMPAFPWLYRVVEDPPDGATTVEVPDRYGPERGTVVATDRAEALVAYLKSLQQAPLPEGRGGAGASGASEGRSASTETKSGANTDGAAVYEAKCASCHQSDGTGLPGSFPPLADDPVVTADDPTRHVEIVLDGLQGKTIEGTSYSAAMPAFGDRLDDSQIAAVVNHERTSWGNDAPTISAEDVAAVRNGDVLRKNGAEGQGADADKGAEPGDTGVATPSDDANRGSEAPEADAGLQPDTEATP